MVQAILSPLVTLQFTAKTSLDLVIPITAKTDLSTSSKLTYAMAYALCEAACSIVRQRTAAIFRQAKPQPEQVFLWITLIL